MARKFRFILQPVLDQRQRVEQEKQRRLGELERERLVAEDALRQTQQEIQSAKMDLRARLGSVQGTGTALVIIPEVRAQANASLHMEAKARLTAMSVAGAYRRVEQARAELLRATTARKAVDLLKEKRHEEWRQAQLRAEAAQVDEAGTQMYIRQRREAQAEQQGDES